VAALFARRIDNAKCNPDRVAFKEARRRIKKKKKYQHTIWQVLTSAFRGKSAFTISQRLYPTCRAREKTQKKIRPQVAMLDREHSLGSG
jgi:hypothetical protein